MEEPHSDRGQLRVLFIEDAASDTPLLLAELRGFGYAPVHRCVWSSLELKAALAEAQWDVILCDSASGEFDGLAALGVVADLAVDIPFIVLACGPGKEDEVAAMKAGATDYIEADCLERLGGVIARELADRRVPSLVPTVAADANPIH